jgi:hypothetical protein
MKCGMSAGCGETLLFSPINNGCCCCRRGGDDLRDDGALGGVVGADELGVELLRSNIKFRVAIECLIVTALT